MMREEFEKLLTKASKADYQRTVSDDIWETVHTVYQWHPAIHDVGGKDEVVKYYLSGVVFDMYPRAKKMEELESDLREKRKAVEDFNAEYKARKDALMESYHETEIKISLLKLPYR